MARTLKIYSLSIFKEYINNILLLIIVTMLHNRSLSWFLLSSWNVVTFDQHGGKALWHWSGWWVFGYDPKSTGNISKHRQMGLHQTKKFLHSKGNNQLNDTFTCNDSTLWLLVCYTGWNTFTCISSLDWIVSLGSGRSKDYHNCLS